MSDETAPRHAAEGRVASHRAALRRAAGCCAALATSLVLAGCSALTGNNPPATPSAAASSAASPTSAATPSDLPPSADPSGTTAATPSLASRDFTGNGAFLIQTQVRLRFDVVELKRRGQLLDLTARVTNLESDRSRDLRWQVGSRFAGSYRRDLTNTDGAFSGVVLTDVAGKKRYLVAADSGNACVCTVQLSGTFVGAGQSAELSATFAAPPPTTTKLDVTVTQVGTFRDLPIS